jgi:hypothetical protein
VPLNDRKAIEDSRAGEVELERIRRVMEALGGRGRFVPWWNGAAADRLLDERHAALVERCVSVFRARSWRTDVEVSYSEFGERGSFDVLATNEEFHAVAVCEVKSEFGSLEDTNRTLDAKERLAPTIVSTRLGWRPRIVADHPADLGGAKCHCPSREDDGEHLSGSVSGDPGLAAGTLRIDTRHLVCIGWTGYVHRFALRAITPAVWTETVQTASYGVIFTKRWMGSVQPTENRLVGNGRAEGLGAAVPKGLGA